METSIKVLVQGRVLRITFTPGLFPQQYNRLMTLVKLGGTPGDIRKVVEPWAATQGIDVTFETE